MKGKIMPKLTKKISETVTLPEKWVSTWNPMDENGKSILRDGPQEYEVGPGIIKIFSLNDQEKAAVQSKCMKTTVFDGKMFSMIDQRAAQEEMFVARCGGSDGYWDGFFGPDDVPLNCTEKNQRRFSWNEGLRIFVVHHAGPILDKMAEGKATDEEKNLLRSLTGTPVGGKGLTPIAGVVRK